MASSRSCDQFIANNALDAFAMAFFFGGSFLGVTSYIKSISKIKKII
jgi:hypothetical protein